MLSQQFNPAAADFQPGNGAGQHRDNIVQPRYNPGALPFRLNAPDANVQAPPTNHAVNPTALVLQPRQPNAPVPEAQAQPDNTNAYVLAGRGLEPNGTNAPQRELQQPAANVAYNRTAPALEPNHLNVVRPENRRPEATHEQQSIRTDFKLRVWQLKDAQNVGNNLAVPARPDQPNTNVQHAATKSVFNAATPAFQQPQPVERIERADTPITVDIASTTPSRIPLPRSSVTSHGRLRDDLAPHRRSPRRNDPRGSGRVAGKQCVREQIPAASQSRQERQGASQSEGEFQQNSSNYQGLSQWRPQDSDVEPQENRVDAFRYFDERYAADMRWRHFKLQQLYEEMVASRKNGDDYDFKTRMLETRIATASQKSITVDDYNSLKEATKHLRRRQQEAIRLKHAQANTRNI